MGRATSIGAGAMAQGLRALAAGTNVLDLRIFSAAAIVMILTAGVATWLPARRILQLDPVDALRAD